MSVVPALDRGAFRRRLEVPALRVPAKRTGEVLQRLRPHLLNMARRRNVESAGAMKMVLLSRELPLEGTLEALPPEVREWLGEVEVTRHAIELDYEYLTAEEALRMVLPVEVPTSFEIVGHVVHLNLRAEQLPWKSIIGEVILDKVKTARTVVNKVDVVATPFRTFPLEVIAGDDDTRVVVRETDCEFRFDLREVYWNSRLQSEHARLSAAIAADSTDPIFVADATCGVGPFAVPLAKHPHVTVYANDLNPAAVRALADNARRNGCSDAIRVRDPGCARDFLRTDAVRYDHVITNLPAAGIDLLDAFRGLRFDENNDGRGPPLVHCYCFAAKTDDVVDAILRRVELALGTSPPPPPPTHQARRRRPFPSPAVDEALRAARDGATTVRWIRNVAPSKDMYCVSFRVPRACADLEYHHRHPPLEAPTLRLDAVEGAGGRTSKRPRTVAPPPGP
ncbi:hypothetical protein CTAYLR_001235 [Chrysophaeum taylorii]|uniref:tRNA (guanine(37)-N1)-methyltransferase n=1 Tax=Chrysophaeum taylorii TaxID=2483200 RepID=A0AAD7UE86_9STRA|nr:hypothetical protein CTAYLR_001235 [Chrysophaeum taylorii]